MVQEFFFYRARSCYDGHHRWQCVHREQRARAAGLFNIVAHYRTALGRGWIPCGRSYNAALC